MKNFTDLLKLIKSKPRKMVAVAACEDKEVLEAVIEASKLQIANFYLFGDKTKTLKILNEQNFMLPEGIEIIDVDDAVSAATKAVQYVNSGKADVLMKGLVDTKVILKEVLNKEYGLRSNSILSHVVLLEIPKLKRLIFLTDAAMNIAPNKDELIAIIENSVTLAKALDFKKPKVALLSAVEKVNEKIPSTVLAKELENYYKDSDDRIVEGPMALDLAISKDAAITKGVKTKIQGDADIIVAPYIEVGNALYKGFVFGAAGVKNAGIIVGAKKPIILTSRADSHEAKLYSIILGLLM